MKATAPTRAVHAWPASSVEAHARVHAGRRLLTLGWQRRASLLHRDEGCDRKSGALKWMGHARRSGRRLEVPARTGIELYAWRDSQEKVVRDFVAAWTKVMDLRPFRRR